MILFDQELSNNIWLPDILTEFKNFDISNSEEVPTWFNSTRIVNNLDPNVIFTLNENKFNELNNLVDDYNLALKSKKVPKFTENLDIRTLTRVKYLRQQGLQNESNIYSRKIRFYPNPIQKKHLLPEKLST